MKTPGFWQKRGLAAFALWPLSLVYSVIHRIKTALQKPITFAVPIICVGNATAGGAGKTPAAMKLAELLLPAFPNLVFLTRGYGGSLQGPVRVNPAHTAKEVGDEPLLLARIAPCFVAKDRVQGAKAAMEAGAGLIIMDDGLQTNRIKKDMSLLVIDGEYGFGNKLLIPAGPLRETVKESLGKSQAVIWIGEQPDAFAIPTYKAALTPKALPPKDVAYTAFAGIGRPEKFFASLEKAGYRLKNTIAFADHHPYSAYELENLLAQVPLITTEKDAVRLPASLREKIAVFPVELEIESPQYLLDRIKQHITKR